MVFFFGTVFAGGVVLATGFVHILPDAADTMGNPCLGLSTTYPWAYVVAGGAALVTFMIEYFLKQIIRKYAAFPSAPSHLGGNGVFHSWNPILLQIELWKVTGRFHLRRQSNESCPGMEEGRLGCIFEARISHIFPKFTSPKEFAVKLC
jgi:hypothetical protein